MITCEPFDDRWGRLGNQMFQAAMLVSVAHLTGYAFSLPRRGQALFDCFRIEADETGPPCSRQFVERYGSCNFDPAVFEQGDGTSYRGYFQSYRYHEGSERRVRELFRFHDRVQAVADAALRACRAHFRRPLAAVHVRRGDYVSTGLADQWGDLAADGYYERALHSVGDGVGHLVFSDDIEWCRHFPVLERARFMHFDTATSLCIMRGCDVHVIANSSFSWWGAYLGPAADVWAPSRWFGPAMRPPNHRQDDILPPTWKRIPALEGGADPATHRSSPRGGEGRSC